ncbi:MAG TPA: hypothetical protein GXZ78_04840 [Eubacteriaceae bacterium]|nr:hypothetical protein [Eubacteriaceae bacterium]
MHKYDEIVQLKPNCRHNLSTYFPGITTLPKVPNPKEALKNYEQEQKQRALERAIRNQKRVVEGTIDKENLKTEKGKLRQIQANMRKHLGDNPQLRRAYRREKVHGSTSKIDTPEFLRISNADKSNRNTVHAIQDDLNLIPIEHRDKLEVLLKK